MSLHRAFYHPRIIAASEDRPRFVCLSNTEHLVDPEYLNLGKFHNFMFYFQLIVFSHTNSTFLVNAASKENLEDDFLKMNCSDLSNFSCQFRMCRIRNIVLSNIAVEPVGEIQIFVVHRNEDVRDEGRHVRQSPICNL